MKYPKLAHSTLANALALMAPMIGTLLLTPVLVSGLGVSRFGIWALVGSAVTFVTTFDLGLAATTLRFAARRDEDGRGEAVVRALVAAAVVLASAVAVVAAVLAGPVVHLLTIPGNDRVEAVQLFRRLGIVLVFPILGGVLTAFLQARGRYWIVAVAAGSTQAAWVGFVIASRSGGWSLVFLADHMALAQSLGFAVLCAGSIRSLGVNRRKLGAAERREVVRFAGGMQLVNVWAFVNLEADTVIVAALLPVRFVGFYVVGMTVATGLRQIPMFALTPLYARLASHGNGSAPVIAQVASAQQRSWMRIIGPTAAAAVPCAGFGVVAWLGGGYGEAALVATLLAAGNAVNLGTGVLSSYVRVIGRPGLEASYGALSALVNLALTVALVVPLGATGVALGTAVGQVVGSLWFVHRCASLEEPLAAFWRGLPLVAMVVAACGAAAGSWAVVTYAGHGPAQLVAAVAVSAASVAVALGPSLLRRRPSAQDAVLSPVARRKVA